MQTTETKHYYFYFTNEETKSRKVSQWLYAPKGINQDLELSHLALKSPFHFSMDAFLNQREITIGLLAVWDYICQSPSSIAQINKS